MNFNILDYKIDNALVPESVYYIPNFLNENEEKQLIEKVKNAPKPKWTYLSNRSLQVYGGYPNPKGMMFPEILPEWLQFYTKRLQLMKVFDCNIPNQVLINCYQPGQGIMAHEDGPLYYPTVATINTGSHTMLNFYEKLTSDENSHCRKYRFSMLLWPKSLSILKYDAYRTYLHEIEPLHTDDIFFAENGQTLNKIIVNLNFIQQFQSVVTNKTTLHLKRDTRYSFTFRFVPKVHKINLEKFLKTY